MWPACRLSAFQSLLSILKASRCSLYGLDDSGSLTLLHPPLPGLNRLCLGLEHVTASTQAERVATACVGVRTVSCIFVVRCEQPFKPLLFGACVTPTGVPHTPFKHFTTSIHIRFITNWKLAGAKNQPSHKSDAFLILDWMPTLANSLTRRSASSSVLYVRTPHFQRPL